MILSSLESSCWLNIECKLEKCTCWFIGNGVNTEVKLGRVNLVEVLLRDQGGTLGHLLHTLIDGLRWLTNDIALVFKLMKICRITLWVINASLQNLLVRPSIRHIWRIGSIQITYLMQKSIIRSLLIMITNGLVCCRVNLRNSTVTTMVVCSRHNF